MKRYAVAVFSSYVLFTSLLSPTWADDWPQWRGPRQDGISRETGLLAHWPEKGPQELWRVPLGNGFSAVSVVGERAYTCFGNDDGEFAVCRNAADGKTLWKTRIDDQYKNDSYGDGPRATPTVDAGCVYVLSGRGMLVCLNAADGKRKWENNLLEFRGGKPPEYGFAASPLVVGEMVIAVIGGSSGKGLAAFQKTTGKLLWSSLGDKIGYSTPAAVTIDGVPQLIVLMGEALVSVSPQDGKEFWRFPWKTEQNANVATPIIANNRLFISTGYSTGCALFQLAAPNGKPAAKRLWGNKEMKNYFATSVLVEGYLYGFDNNKLACQDFRTGKVKWRAGGFNRGSLIVAEGRLILLSASGVVALAELSSQSYREISRFQFCDERTWTVPTLSAGRLFLRNEKELACYELAK